MFLEDSSVGREVWRESYLSLLNKVSQLFPVVLQQESLRDGPLCYIAVKVQGVHCPSSFISVSDFTVGSPLLT